MLYTNTVSGATLDILKKIMVMPDLNDFNLVGGTALALQMGHRISVDLDFFGKKSIDRDEIFALLSTLGDIQLMSQSKNVLVLSLNGIKLDFVNYSYPLLYPLIIDNDIRLLSFEDIGAMKLAAIIGRGTKRDFTDLFFLLQKFSLEEIVSFYNRKYHDGSEFLLARSLAYFDDADQDTTPILLKECNWEEVKRKIQNEVTLLYS